MLPFRPYPVQVHWFSLRGALIRRDDSIDVFIGGVLIGTFRLGDVAARNTLLVALASDPRMHLGQLAAAFDISTETLRQLRRLHERGGIRSVLQRPEHGGPKKLTEALRARIEKELDGGLTISEVHEKVRRKVSRSAVGMVRKQWATTRGIAEQAARPKSDEPDIVSEPTASDAVPAGSDSAAPVQSLCESHGETVGATSGSEIMDDPTSSAAEPAEPPTAPPGWGSEEESRGAKANVAGARLETGRGIQHVGSWVMIAMLHTMGLYRNVRDNYSGRFRASAIRVALDGLVIALSIGERCVEGVRRLATPTARLLLRARHAPSASWVRRVLGSVAHEHGGERLQVLMAQEYMRATLAVSNDDRPSIFYIDNHLRPYTGDQVIRKGWRMQDKRVRPGVSDYYVHDEDGRPVLRVDVPSHDSLTTWLPPIAELLRDGLGEDRRVLVAFDRAGAFAEHLAELRDHRFELVTYERRPYPELPIAAFDRAMRYQGEVVALREKSLKNLGNGRGRVRRISFRAGDSGHQVNLLAVSSLSAEELYLVMRGRWGQENGLKHGVERWGINQLDGRTVEPVPADTVIPNPARRRLDEALRIERAREGHARRHLARLAIDDPSRQRWDAELADALALQAEFEALRPMVPKHAPVGETELADTLVQHTSEYKALIDAVRIACANAESELACVLAPALRRPAEAKRVIQNLLAAPGSIHAGATHVTVRLQPAGTQLELAALRSLLAACTRWELTMPDDPQNRPLRFEVQA